MMETRAKLSAETCMELLKTNPLALMGMSEEEYRGLEAVNKSTLWEIRKSPAHYKWALTHPAEETPALRIGRAVHSAVLTPGLFDSDYSVAPHCDRRTKEGKAEWAQFLEESEGTTILSESEYEIVDGIRRSIYLDDYEGNDKAYDLIDELIGRVDEEEEEDNEGIYHEVPLVWRDENTGLICKCRLDSISVRDSKIVVTDLKTTADAGTEPFMRHCMKYGYDVQMAHYIRGVKAVFGDEEPIEWWFIAAEKKPPYAFNIRRMGNDMLDRGTMLLNDLMDRLKKCVDRNVWPGYGSGDAKLPDWALVPEDLDELDEMDETEE